MHLMSIEQIREIVGGTMAGAEPSPGFITKVCTDTRKIEPGCLYIALHGEKFDAHDFLPNASLAGASAAMVHKVPEQPIVNLPMIVVQDTRKGLGALAKFARTQLRGQVIAVAGSNGKTSTKCLIHSVLSSAMKGTMSPKSFNNDIGVPLTILPADVSDDFLVLELGTNHPGEIATLTDIAAADIGVITNCGAEHLEFLGDIEGVRAEEATLVDGMDPRGTLVVNGDDEELLAAVKRYHGKRITFGTMSHNDLFAKDVVCTNDGTTFKLNGRREVFLPMIGKHNAINALCAIAVARTMGMSEDRAIEALATAKGPDMRLEVQQLAGGATIVNDAYNANPNSMQAALETIAALPCTGRRMALLGDMLELGETTERYHREIGEFAAESKLDWLGCVGEKAQMIAESAKQAGMANVECFVDASAAANAVRSSMRRGDMLLLKASRGIQLERVAAALHAHAS